MFIKKINIFGKQNRAKGYNIIINYIIILLLFISFGYLLLVLCDYVPKKWISENAYNYSMVLGEEGYYPETTSGKYNTARDNFTDGLMLHTAIYDNGKSHFDRALAAYKIEYEDGNYMYGAARVLTGYKGNRELSYPRYWHGYLTYLIPLLLFNDAYSMRLLMSIIHVIMLAFVILKFHENKLDVYGLAYLISISFISLSTIFDSLQYFPCFFIMNLMIYAILTLYNRNNNMLKYVFLIGGILVNYFDFLTYPSITLGVPLAVYISLYLRDSNSIPIKSIIMNYISWFVGYAGMWMGKWTISTIILKKNIFLNAYENILFRGGYSDGNKITNYFQSLNINFKLIYSKLLIVFMILGFVIFIFTIIKNKISFKKVLRNLIYYSFVIVVPFIWYFGLTQHSYVHPFFTYRTFLSAIVGCLFFLFSFVNNEKK